MPRQQTLQATVDWSFSLLTQQERNVLTWLSVFVGGFDLAAAEAIFLTEGIDALDLLDLLGSLVDKSLVVADHTPRAVRYRLLETIRQYSAQELLRAESDDGVLAVRDHHARYYVALAEAAQPHLRGHGQGEWLRRLDLEWDNIRAALAHLAAEERTEDILCVGGCLLVFAITRGHPDLLAYLRPAVDESGATPSVVLAEAMTVTGVLIGLLHRADPGELPVARDYAERALAMAVDLGDRRAQAHALAKLQESAAIVGDLATMRQLAEQGVAIARELGDKELLGEQLAGLAAASSGDEQRQLRLDVLACARESGDDLLAINELNHLFGIELQAGNLEACTPYLEEAVELVENVGGELLQHLVRTNVVLLRLLQGRPVDAEPILRKVLHTSRRLGPGIPVSEMIFAAACCAAFEGDYQRAARLHGAGDADIQAALAIRMISWSDAEQSLREREQQLTREKLGDEAYEQAYRAGSRLTMTQATDLALSRGPSV
jgi:hypothetical protein